ncbi:MAG: tRNA threonylcarbamoyladenosine dehydratase [Firmicutes bacterium]|nr:tRNA threonylcarbamoyladenosine dehydratase [Bacillota bacterium]
MLHRFSRTELVVGTQGLATLQHATVAVIGLGGVGSYTAEALARSGVGRLILVDKDVIDITNINRQIPALTETIGRPKVEVMAERIHSINPDCEVVQKQIFFLKDTETDILEPPLDYVADAIDTVSAKIHLALSCRARQIPYVASMGAANKLDPTAFRVMDLFDTHMDPIARVMRRELRKHGVHKGVTVVCSEEPPRKADAEVLKQIAPSIQPGETLPRKAQNPPASIAFVPPIPGLILASVIVRDLVGLR